MFHPYSLDIINEAHRERERRAAQQRMVHKARRLRAGAGTRRSRRRHVQPTLLSDT